MSWEVVEHEKGVAVIDEKFGIIAILESDFAAQNWIESSAEDYVRRLENFVNKTQTPLVIDVEEHVRKFSGGGGSQGVV